MRMSICRQLLDRLDEAKLKVYRDRWMSDSANLYVDVGEGESVRTNLRELWDNRRLLGVEELRKHFERYGMQVEAFVQRIPELLAKGAPEVDNWVRSFVPAERNVNDRIDRSRLSWTAESEIHTFRVSFFGVGKGFGLNTQLRGIPGDPFVGDQIGDRKLVLWNDFFVIRPNTIHKADERLVRELQICRHFVVDPEQAKSHALRLSMSQYRTKFGFQSAQNSDKAVHHHKKMRGWND